MIMNSKFNNFTETELEREQWRDIAGYDGMYQVSSLGRVRSKHSGEWKVMKPSKNDNGYLIVDLLRCGKRTRKRSRVHRLVAQAFIPNNDSSKTLINHRNECKSDNRVSNLEYCTAQYNVTYNDIQFRKKNSKRRKIEKLYDPNLSILKNLEIFKANGIECCKETVVRLRKELGLTRQRNIRHKLKGLYDPNLSYEQNIELFRANGVECSKYTIRELRRDLGLTKHYKPRKTKQIS